MQTHSGYCNDMTSQSNARINVLNSQICISCESYYTMRTVRSITKYPKRHYFNPINVKNSTILQLKHHGDSTEGEKRSCHDHLGGPSSNGNRGGNRGNSVATGGSGIAARRRGGGVAAGGMRLAILAVGILRLGLINLLKVGAGQAGGIGVVDDKGSVAKEGRVAGLERSVRIGEFGDEWIRGNLAILSTEITDLARRGLGRVASREVATLGRIEVAESCSAVATGGRLDVKVVD